MLWEVGRKGHTTTTTHHQSRRGGAVVAVLEARGSLEGRRALWKKKRGRKAASYQTGEQNIFCLPTWVRNVAVVAVAFVAVVAVVATSSVADASSVFPFGNVGKLMIFHSLFTGFSFL